MQFIPNTAIQFTNKEYTDKRILDSHEAASLVEKYVSADCWALMVNDEIIYNYYDVTKSLREKIIDKTIRSAIIKNPHANLLVEIYRQDKDATVRLFMFGSHSWEIRLIYLSQLNSFAVCFYKTVEYKFDKGEKANQSTEETVKKSKK